MSIDLAHLFALAAVFFVTSAITVITGGTALITVPAMILFGVPARVALATNMVALTLMSMGGVIPFVRGNEIDRRRAPVLLALTLVGSVTGALLVFQVPSDLLPAIIPLAMIFVLIFLLANPRQGLHDGTPPSPARNRAGFLAMFALGIYGGFFSGGYVTMLMAAGVFFFRYSFLRSMATSRLMNIASSLIATCVFAWNGAIDWKLALPMGCASFAGALCGAHWARRVPEKVLRTIFVLAVAVLALKSLAMDVPWHAVRLILLQTVPPAKP